MKINHFADAGKTNPIKPNFKGKKMLRQGDLDWCDTQRKIQGELVQSADR